MACSCSGVEVGFAGVAVDILVDSLTNPLVTQCGWCIHCIFVAAAQAVGGATLEAGRAASARSFAPATAVGVPWAQ